MLNKSFAFDMAVSEGYIGFMSIIDERPKIELPDYKTPPPYGGSVLAWWGFFLRPHTWWLVLWYGVSITRRVIFGSHAFFLGVAIGMIESGAAKENTDALVSWFILYGVIHAAAYLAIAVIVPAGSLMDIIAKQVALFGFEHYLKLPESWHEEKASGEKLTRLTTARKSVNELMHTFFWNVTELPGLIVVIVLSMMALGAPYYYVLLYMGFVTSFLVIGFWTGHWLNKRFADENSTLEKVIGGVYEFIVSTSTVRFFNLKQHVLKRGAELEWDNHLSKKKIFITVIKRWILLDFIGLLWMIAITWVATYQALRGDLSIAVYTTIVFLNITIWIEMENLTVIYKDLIERWEGFKRLTEVLNQKPSIEDADGAVALREGNASISFDSVTFQYNESRDVIDGFDLDIKAGEKIGMLGPSGAGKSTIVKLLLRFYDLEDGTIRIGGQAIRDVTLQSLQAAIAVIPQDITLFNHPLIENIRYGRLDASDEEVMEAARRANAHEFILELPDGYQTLVGERGVKLSGGQRQRIAIARAILKDAPILILDEATSALDSESEQLIQASLESLMEGKTVIAIAHRLSTISSLDRLVVMKNGGIVEHGSHEELLALEGGLYAHLWGMQSGGFISE